MLITPYINVHDSTHVDKVPAQIILRKNSQGCGTLKK